MAGGGRTGSMSVVRPNDEQHTELLPTLMLPSTLSNDDALGPVINSSQMEGIGVAE